MKFAIKPGKCPKYIIKKYLYLLTLTQLAYLTHITNTIFQKLKQ